MKHILYFAIASFFMTSIQFSYAQQVKKDPGDRVTMHHEEPDQPYVSASPGARRTSPACRFSGEGFFTSQVNVDTAGNNIEDDAANEPSIAVNPVNPNQIVIGWRQFDDVNNNFRQAGYGFSSDGGQTWTFPGVIEPGIFRSDPVLDADAAGNLFYNSLTTVTGDYTCNVYKSINGGATWDAGVEAHGGDKQWMTIDASGGPGNGNIYSAWNSGYSSCYPGFFTRSTNNGASFEDCIPVDGFPYWGTMAVGPDGELYIAGASPFDGVQVTKSTNAQIPGSTLTWNSVAYVSLDGFIIGQDPINPVGILGQANVDVDRSNGPGRGNVYVLASVMRNSVTDPADVMFAKSTNGGLTFSAPQRLNTDPPGNYQWFGTLSVAPNGRIDVIWLDTRDSIPGSYFSSLYYCYSQDQGNTWSINKRLSPAFDPTVGYPQQLKMGDYYDMVSDDNGAHLAWANTLNGEEDVYYTHITPTIVGMDDRTREKDIVSVSVYPNPVGENTVINYRLPQESNVRAEILNPYGEVVKVLLNTHQQAGTYTLDAGCGTLSPGVYFCRLSAGGDTESTRLIKLK